MDKNNPVCLLCNRYERCPIKPEECSRINYKDKLMFASGQSWWDEWARTSPPDPQNVQREPLLHLPGPPAKGGGSKVKRKRKAARKRVDTLHTWENCC